MWSGIKISPRLAGLSERHVLVPRRREMANETAHTSTDSRGYEINGPFRAQRLHTRARAHACTILASEWTVVTDRMWLGHSVTINGLPVPSRSVHNAYSPEITPATDTASSAIPQLSILHYGIVLEKPTHPFSNETAMYFPSILKFKDYCTVMGPNLCVRRAS
jgi:hypothetical protein